MTLAENERIKYIPIEDLHGEGEITNNVARIAALFPDAVTDGRIDLEALSGFLGEDVEPAGSETSGFLWVGMAEERRLSTLPATGTLLPRPDESVGCDSTQNIVIEGDNLEVLRLLRRGYTNEVDVIYIDPPYNTGNDFVYDDRRVSTVAEHEANAGLRDEEGATQVGSESANTEERRLASARHAKWLSMMYPRLLVAHSLLRETGVLIAAIDDNEHARLKLLLDRVFGAENFVANVVWQGGVDGYASYVSSKHDYMLVYAKNKGHLDAKGIQWREPSDVAAAAVVAVNSFWETTGHDVAESSRMLRHWWRETVATNPDASSFSHYDAVDEQGRAYFGGDAGAPEWRSNRCFKQLLHPITGKPTPAPENGWRWDEAELDRRLREGLIVFGQDETTVPKRKSYLDPGTGQVPRSVFQRDRRGSSSRLKALLGSKAFQYPKDESVLARWINLVSSGNENALVLDFFAGSGSTGHAVMNLNASDGGNRHYMLVQLDEKVGQGGYDTIADITRERLRRAGKKIGENLTPELANMDLGFRSYRLGSSNLKPWDGTGQLNLMESVDNLVQGRSIDDLLVEMMLRLGIELTTPVETREVAGSRLFNLGGGTLYAYFGDNVTTEQSIEVARGLVQWRDESPVDSDVTIVVRDTGFIDSSAKLNLDAAVKQAGFTTFRSI